MENLFSATQQLLLQLDLSGEPNNVGGEHCMELIFAGTGEGKWNDGDCDQTLSYMCKRSRKCERKKERKKG